MKKETVGILQMILCASMWSIAGVMLKYIPWNGMVIAGIRALIAGVVIGIYLWIRRMPVTVNRKSVRCGIFCSMTCMLFIIANKLTTAANAIVLQFTAPVFLLVYSSALFHRKFRRADILAVVLTMAGISLFFFDQLRPGAFLGNILSIAAGHSMGLMYLFMGEADEQERLSSLLISEAITAVIGIPFAFFTTVEVATIPVLFILILGIFQLGIPYVLYGLAAGKCPPLACCLIGALEPLLNPVWVMLFYGETPGLFALAGGIAVIATVTCWSLYNGKHPQTE